MDLSIKEVARILGVSEATVRNHIASGKLPARKIGRRLVVAQVELDAFAAASGTPPAVRDGGDDHASVRTSHPETLHPVLHRLAAIEERMGEILELTRENRALFHELREKDRELARKELKIEKLNRDLVYQKRIHQKEMEDHEKLLHEKWALMERETAEKVSREQEHLEKRLIEEQNLSSERMKQLKEEFARRLHDATRHESFWTRLMKMMTWS